MMTLDDLLRLIGAKEVEIALLRKRVAELEAALKKEGSPRHGETDVLR